MITITDVKDDLTNRVDEFAHKIRPIYVLLEWEWSCSDGPHIPTKADIVETLHSLIATLNEDIDNNSTGGLSVGYKARGCNIVEAFMRFNVSEEIYYYDNC
jgi:hypothetical protein